MNELNKLDATAQAQLVKDGEVTALELVDAAITRYEEINPSINAVIHTHFDRARDQSQAITDNSKNAPFSGVPFLLKDLGGGNLKGDPIYWGTRFLKDADFRASTTSNIVQRFIDAGLIIIGRTNVPELGAWCTTEPESYGPCRNPWNLNHSTGGSSGGAAASVISGIVPMAHASDGGGSIRNPASQCGVVGLKPSRGRISLGPDVGESWAGLVFEFAETRTIRDCATLLDCVQGNTAGDPYTVIPPVRPYSEEVGKPPGKLRVGILNEFRQVQINPFSNEESVTEIQRPVADAVSRVGEILSGLGHQVELSHPDSIEDSEIIGQVINIIASYQAHDVARFGEALGREIQAEDMDCDNWAVTQLGQMITSSQYLGAVDALNQFCRRTASWWESGYDLLITPTIPETPPELGLLVPDTNNPLKGFLRSGALIPFMMPFNMTGQPAMSLPLTQSDDGLPIGIQLVSAFGREDVLFRIASQLEEAMPWHDRSPNV